MWNVECIPWNKGPIRAMNIHIVAESRKEAELIVISQAHKFFDQDIRYIWNTPIEGYRDD